MWKFLEELIYMSLFATIKHHIYLFGSDVLHQEKKSLDPLRNKGFKMFFRNKILCLNVCL